MPVKWGFSIGLPLRGFAMAPAWVCNDPCTDLHGFENRKKTDNGGFTLDYSLLFKNFLNF